MKLFKVRLSIEAVVWAEDEAHALQVAKDQAQGDIRLADPDDARAIVTPEDIPAKWDTGSLPWGREDEVTIGEIMGVKRC